MGTSKESFVELTERIGRKTGGVSVYPFTRYGPRLTAAFDRTLTAAFDRSV
jgi:hypothetical protein